MLNVITLVGRLTRDPELRRTASGTAIGGFTVACDDGRKGPNGERQTLFMDCSIFGNQADTLMKFFHKGNLIGVYGRLTSRKYTNQQGVTVTAYQIIADRIEFVEPAAKSGDAATIPAGDDGYQTQTSPASEKHNMESISVDDADLPF